MSVGTPLMGTPSFTLDTDRRASDIRAAFDAEFHTRPDGYRGLRLRYGLDLPEEPRQMAPGLLYGALAKGEVDVINGFSTDGRIAAYDLCVLADDKGFFPPYEAVPVARQQVLEEHPEVGSILGFFSGRVTAETIQRLNYEVDEMARDVADVARQFLVAENIVPVDCRRGEGATSSVTVGAKQFTEQLLIGEIIAVLIECNSDIRVVRRLGFGDSITCFNGLRAGDIDLYVEYTGTGLVSILENASVDNPDAVYWDVRATCAREHGVIWLKPLGYQSSYVIVMRSQHAGQLRVKTISDLAQALGAKRETESFRSQLPRGVLGRFWQWLKSAPS